MTAPKVLGLIPARAGSKGIPRKNVKALLGKSLIQRACESAVESGVLDRVILSTDDPEAARIAREIGLETPFRRPDELSGDDVAMIDVILHSLGFLRKTGYVPQAVLLLQPTSPFRTVTHIHEAVRRLDGYDAVCSVTPLPRHLCPHYVMRISNDGFLQHFLPDGEGYTRRQDVPQAYFRDGTIYLTRTDVLLSQRGIYGSRCHPMILSADETLTIDDEVDWQECVRRLQMRDTASPRGKAA